ncbi:MAG: hypothetical protein JSV32_01575 [Dehalococcoidia bacterium]|nr:MAG: hypothetical protein JSV32_01575 [Dehalococcoidia bacterium]
MLKDADNIDRKLDLLKDIIRSYGDMVLAFSGGKDSTLLLTIGAQVLDSSKLVAVTAVSPIKREEERELATALCSKMEINHRIIETNEYKNPEFIKYPKKRCLICKEELYRSMREVSHNTRLSHLIEGTNCDDIKKERPVDKLAQKYDIRRPLVEAGITTFDILTILDQMGLKNYIRPHYTSCKPWEILF